MLRTCVAISLWLGCSSSAKQPDEPARTPGSAVTAKPAEATPAADLALLRADVDVICSAAKVTGGTTWIDVGPHIAENMKTAHKVGLFADHRTTTLDEFFVRIRDLMAKANVPQCDTLDVLIKNDPRKRG